MSAVGIAAAFLPTDAVVLRVAGRMEDANQTLYARPEYYSSRLGTDPFQKLSTKVKQLPLIVLVDSKTTSGAEAVAGALQGNRRTIVVGERTPDRAPMLRMRLRWRISKACCRVKANRKVRKIVQDLLVRSNEQNSFCPRQAHKFAVIRRAFARVNQLQNCCGIKHKLRPLKQFFGKALNRDSLTER